MKKTLMMFLDGRVWTAEGPRLTSRQLTMLHAIAAAAGVPANVWLQRETQDVAELVEDLKSARRVAWLILLYAAPMDVHDALFAEREGSVSARELRRRCSTRLGDLNLTRKDMTDVREGVEAAIACDGEAARRKLHPIKRRIEDAWKRASKSAAGGAA